MKIFTAAAVAILLSSGVAYAQDTSTTTGSTQGSDTDPSNYLAGPNIHRFYTDESMTTLRPQAEIMSTWQGMSAEEQANLKEACQGNKDSRWSTLCNSIGTM